MPSRFGIRLPPLAPPASHAYGSGVSLTPTAQLDALLARAPAQPLLALAPMQDVTNLGFWRLMSQYGGADVYYTEYFRVHPDSHLEKYILRSLTQNPTGKPAVAQMIGNDVPSLVRGAKELQQHAVAAIDLNLGCPAPVVYRKCAGGGLLRDIPRVEGLLAGLREAVSIKFTVKTRLGFDDTETIDALIPLFIKHGVDLVTIHGRTVTQMYRDGVRYDRIAQARAALPCPVLANGNIGTHLEAEAVWRETGVAGLMIGRGAIRNPWLFNQIRQHLAGQPVFQPTREDRLTYVRELFDAVVNPDSTPLDQAHHIKKHLNFFGPEVADAPAFLHDMRRCTTQQGIFDVCARYF